MSTQDGVENKWSTRAETRDDIKQLQQEVIKAKAQFAQVSRGRRQDSILLEASNAQVEALTKERDEWKTKAEFYRNQCKKLELELVNQVAGMHERSFSEETALPPPSTLPPTPRPPPPVPTKRVSLP